MLSTLCGMGCGGGGVWPDCLSRGDPCPAASLPRSPPVRPPVPEGVACGSDALTLLESSETRSQFIDELMEVRTTRQPGLESG